MEQDYKYEPFWLKPALLKDEIVPQGSHRAVAALRDVVAHADRTVRTASAIKLISSKNT